MKVSIYQLPAGLSMTDKNLKKRIQVAIKQLKFTAQAVTFIFVSDDELAELHEIYLQDPAQTDVITFNLGDDSIEGEIYISTDRAQAQAVEFDVSFEEEIMRLMVHGLLHLAGYNDLDKPDQLEMKHKEDQLVQMITKD